jgi:DNA-binding LytR/AlgR family response regulator
MAAPAATDRISSILIVEDEALVALNLEAMLEEIGYTVVGPALRYDAAVALVESGVAADAAILDVNIGGRKVFPVAEMLVARGVTIVFATGYGREGLPPEWQDYPVIQKPYTLENLGAMLSEAVGRVG